MNTPRWRVAPSLLTLRGQLDELYPLRSTAIDGFIGDENHQSRASDHNPWWRYDGMQWVTAGDFTHDPDGGINCHVLADALTTARDKRVKYIIWDGRICNSSRVGIYAPWEWREYDGPNKHRSHLHLSVRAHPDSLDTLPWLLPGMDKPPAFKSYGGTVIPIQLPTTPAAAPGTKPDKWEWREEVVSLGYVQGWRGKCMLRLSAGHPGAQIFRAHVDVAAGDRSAVHHWPGIETWPGVWLPPAYAQARELVMPAPAGPAALMVTYAAPGGLSLNVEWEK